jgi:hypothetical protein
VKTKAINRRISAPISQTILSSRLVWPYDGRRKIIARIAETHLFCKAP